MELLNTTINFTRKNLSSTMTLCSCKARLDWPYKQMHACIYHHIANFIFDLSGEIILKNNFVNF